MSEYDKNKFFRRKFYSTQREGSHQPHPHYATRPYNKNSLFRYDREYKEAEKTEKPETKEKPIQQPTILQKVRTERSVSPKRTKENEQTTSQTSVVSHEPVSIAPPNLTSSIKLIEDGVVLFESIQEYLQDSPDFLVVGVLGNQGTGKSSILNLLSQSKITQHLKQNVFAYKEPPPAEPVKILSDSMSNVKLSSTESHLKYPQNDVVFKPQTLEQIENGHHGTSGVDLYITNNRVFLLDCQPIISTAVLDEIVNSDLKRSSIAGEFLPIENCAEIQSLQFATFILSVCHVVLLVQDWFFDSNFARFMQTAEMLKPNIPMAEEDFIEYFPHVMLVHNRATLEDFTPSRFKLIQNTYREVFSKSKFHLDSGMGLGTGQIIRSLNPFTCGDALNLFLIPEYEGEEQIYRNHPHIDDLIRELRSKIHSVTRIPLLSAQITEKNWLQFATRVWDTIKKSPYFLEYSKLMP